MNISKMSMNEVSDMIEGCAKRASGQDAAILREVAKRIRRRSPARKSQPVSRTVTPLLRKQIRTFCLANPDMAQVEVAHRFNVNPGRVSEAVAGFRLNK